MPDYPISPEAAEAALDAYAEAGSESERASAKRLAAAINAFLAAEGFEVEENILPTSYEKRLVGPWRAFEG